MRIQIATLLTSPVGGVLGSALVSGMPKRVLEGVTRQEEWAKIRHRLGTLKQLTEEAL